MWFRAVDPRYLTSALTTYHTVGLASRFSQGKSEILYLAEDPLVALHEVGSLLGTPYLPGGSVAHPRRSFVTLAITVSLVNVVDLTDTHQQAVVDTNAQELTGDWQGYRQRSALTSVSGPVGSAPTQKLGNALRKLPGVEAFVTLSARIPVSKALVIFPRKLTRPHSVTCSYTDPTGRPVTLSLP